MKANEKEKAIAIIIIKDITAIIILSVIKHNTSLISFAALDVVTLSLINNQSSRQLYFINLSTTNE